MKRIGLLLLGISSQIIFAQATRFVYQVTMKPDSTDRNTIKTELAHLDVSPDGSIFYAENRLKRDSVMSRMRQTGSFNFNREQMQSLRTSLDFIIEKESKSGKKIYKSNIMRDQYAYEEDRPMNWKILPETATIGEYKTQKAETNFAGRTWNAWFTTEIPLQDGPYKFAGLPGLIVKVEDEKGDYSFDLKESKKIAGIASFEQRGTPISVKRAAFEKQQAQYRKDPAAALASMNSGRMRIQMNPDQRRQMEERTKQEAARNNNPIELK